MMSDKTPHANNITTMPSERSPLIERVPVASLHERDDYSHRRVQYPAIGAFGDEC